MSTVNFCGGVPREAVPAVKTKVANATEKMVSKPEIQSFPDMVAKKAKKPQANVKPGSEYLSPFTPYEGGKIQEVNSVLAKDAARKTYETPVVPYN